MQYPLSPVYQLVHERIHPHTVLNHPELLATDHALWEQITQQVNESQLHLMNFLLQGGGTDALHARVPACQAGYIHLVNRLEHYLYLTEQISAGKNARQLLQQAYTQLQGMLIDHLRYLYEHFTAYFDQHQQVPVAVWQQQQQSWALEVTRLQTQWLEAGTDPLLVQMVLGAVEKQVVQSPPASYRQSAYVQALLAALERCQPAAPVTPATERLINLLNEHNFNYPPFISYQLQLLYRQLPEDSTVPEQAASWALHLKHYRQLYCSAAGWLAPAPAVGEAISKQVRQELIFCYRTIKLHASAVKNTTPVPGVPAPAIVTNLSVGQIAVLMRLLVDCGIVQCSNQTALLKQLAGIMKTTRTSTISAESLRIKYYAPDRAAISIANEYIIKMLNCLKQY